MAEVQQAHIFISYARKDMGKVRKLYEFLKGYGFSPWMDIFDLKTGQDWFEVVNETIHELPIFLACFSNHSITKQGVVRREINETLDMAKERILSGEDVYIFPIRLEEIASNKKPMKLKRYNWVDWYSEDGKSKLIKDLKDTLKRLGFDNPLNLRSQPLENLSPAAAAQMIKERNFYSYNYWLGRGIHHGYEPKIIDGDKIVIDHTTGLTWQQSGSDTIVYEKVQDYINQVKRDKFAGFDDWRLPTLEEAMSLIEPMQKNEDLYIDPVFDQKQRWIWTGDRSSACAAWYIGFDIGNCYYNVIGYNFIYVRAVRSG